MSYNRNNLTYLIPNDDYLIIIGDMKVQLSKYLLHTICTDLTNQLLRYIAQDYKLTVPEDTGAFNKVHMYMNNTNNSILMYQTLHHVFNIHLPCIYIYLNVFLFCMYHVLGSIYFLVSTCIAISYNGKPLNEEVFGTGFKEMRCCTNCHLNCLNFLNCFKCLTAGLGQIH